MPLSETDAIALSDELVDVAVKIRALESKYKIESDGGLGAALLAALRPHANVAQVVANLQLGGLSLAKPLLSPSDQPKQDSTPKSPLSALQLGPSGYACNSFPRQTSGAANFPRQVSNSDPWQRQLSQESTSDPWQRQVSSESIGDFSGGGRGITLVPSFSADAAKWTIAIEVAPEGQVRHMRRQVARSLKLPFGKILLIDDTEAAPGSMGRLLSDTEPAAKATRMHIANLAKSPGLAAKQLTRELALTLQKEILAELNESSRSERLASQPKECLAEVQAQVLPRHGFQSAAPTLNSPGYGPASLVSMLAAFDNLAQDPEVAKAGDAINEKLGFRPQLYAINDTEEDF